jgi:glycosyltransferase involved in cell wall biosynthesis
MNNQVAEIKLAFIGSVVKDEPRYHSIAFSRAGNLFQTNLLSSLRRSCIPVSTVISSIPIQAWPSGQRLLVKRTKYLLKDDIAVSAPGFVNIQVLKQLTIGIAVFWRLLIWGWRNRKYRYRVVSTYNLSVPPGLFTLAAARLIRAKLVAYIIDVNVPGETVPRLWRFVLDYRIQRWLMPRFDGLVIVSDAIVQDFGLRVPHIRVEGAISELPPVSEVRDCDPSCFVIVSAGSLDEPNGFRVLLASFSKLEGKHYRLRIAGDGPLKSVVMAAAERDSRIEYCGYLAHSEVLRLYQSGDVLVNLRLTKSLNTKYFFPSKLIEYLASGCPVITTCTGHVEEEFGNFTFLLRDETPEGLVSAIQEVERLGKEVRLRKASLARKYVADNLTWDVQGRRIAAFIKSLCE